MDISSSITQYQWIHAAQFRVELNLNFEFESAHELLMNLKLTFTKSMNLSLKSLSKHSMN